MAFFRKTEQKFDDCEGIFQSVLEAKTANEKRLFRHIFTAKTIIKMIRLEGFASIQITVDTTKDLIHCVTKKNKK